MAGRMLEKADRRFHELGVAPAESFADYDVSTAILIAMDENGTDPEGELGNFLILLLDCLEILEPEFPKKYQDLLAGLFSHITSTSGVAGFGPKSGYSRAEIVDAFTSALGWILSNAFIVRK